MNQNQFKWVFFLLVVGVVLRLPLAFAPLTYSETDDWRQADTASIARHFERNGFNLLYPQIYWGGDGPGYVETEFQLYPFVVALLYRVFGEQVWLGRLFSLVMSIAALWLFYRWAARVVSFRAAVWGLFLLVISPLSIRYSTAFMPEATVFLFYVGALYLFSLWLEWEQFPLLLATGVVTALAILVKPTSIHIGFIFLLLLLQKYGLRAFARTEVLAFAAVCLLPGILWYIHARDIYLTYGNTFGIISGGDSKFGGLRDWLSPSFYWRLALLDVQWVFGWFSTLIFLAGVLRAATLRAPKVLFYGLVSILIYYLLVSRYAQETWGVQYHIYLLPYAALGFGIGMHWLSETPLWARTVAVRAVVIVFLVAGAVIAGRSLLQPSRVNLMDCAETVSRVVPQDARIVVSTTSESVVNDTPNNFQEPQIFYYSDRYGWSLAADQHQPQFLMDYRSKGADYFVLYEPALLEENPELKTYLTDSMRQIDSAPEQSCSVYTWSS